MRTATCFLVVSLLTMAPGRSEVIPGRWEKVDSLFPDTFLVVKLHSGDRFEGRFRGSDSEFLLLVEQSHGHMRLPKASVARVLSGETDDRLVNGTLIGAAAGFGAGFFLLAAYNARETASGPIWDGEALAHYASAGIVGAGVGALTGALIDKTKKHREELYRSR